MMRIIHNAEWQLYNGTNVWYLQKIVHISWGLVLSDFGVLDDIYNGRYLIIPREMCRLLEDTENLQSENRKIKQEMKSEMSKLYNEQYESKQLQIKLAQKEGEISKLKRNLSDKQMQFNSLLYYEMVPLRCENEILRDDFKRERQHFRLAQYEKQMIIAQNKQEKNARDRVITDIQCQVNQLQQENEKLRKQMILRKEGKTEIETHSSTTLHGRHGTDLNKVNEMQSRRKENSSEHLRPEQPLREKKIITNDEILERIKKPKEIHNNSGLKEANETLQNNIKVLQESLKEKHAELEECRLQLHRKREQIMFLQLKLNDKLKLDKEQAKIKEQENTSICSDLQQIIDDQKSKISYLEAKLETAFSNRKFDLGLEENLFSGKDIQLQLADTRCRLNDVQQELEETKSRLSRAMGDKLTDNNPNIADLSDKNRPTKISERYQELYDNQWTDAFEIIDKAFNNEEKTINTLTVIIKEWPHPEYIASTQPKRRKEKRAWFIKRLFQNRHHKKLEPVGLHVLPLNSQWLHPEITASHIAEKNSKQEYGNYLIQNGYHKQARML